jgi:hypothetical protein
MSNIDPGDIDFLPAKIVADLQAPPPGVIVVWGYLGQAPARGAVALEPMPPVDAAAPAPPAAPKTAVTDTYWRLYRTLLFNEYLEFRDADVVFYRKLREGDDWAGTVVWLKEGAPVNYVRSEAMEAQRGFLQGDIAGSGSGQPGMPGGAGGSFLCNGAGLGVGTGMSTVTAFCNGAAASFMCAPNMPGSFLCGGGGGSFLCGGAGGSFLCGGAGGSFVYC